ncbi:response regulator transcription factor [Amycolatopsis suaedae]|uniref:Response regulator transcription factor n=2 Tax=Amycolatopsis suaedae TaxID=2510978 RepID=A0A4Q7JGT0_9PSEU|nr:response regulator transcription factor [Amycolatopsis suaedae]
MRQLRRLPLYTDFYRPRGTVDQLLCVVGVDDRHGSVLTVNRSRSGFTARDRMLVELIAPHLARALAWQRLLAAQPRPEVLACLTPRQRQIAGLVARGRTDREIARELAISPRTVHKHLELTYRTLGLTNRTGLVAALTGQVAAWPTTT